jgi:hypothetical protein
MAAGEHRSRARHYPVGWKVALEFNEDDDKRVVQSWIRDLSTVGAAVHTNDRDLTGTVVRLSIAYPDAPEQKPLKIRARVVSSARKPGMTQYRHGLSFIRLPFDGRAELEKILRSLPPDAKREEPAAPAPERDGVAVRRGRLAQLRELAEVKRAEAKKPDPRDENAAAISEALRTAYQYLRDLAEQLNVIHPVYPKTYAIPGVPDFKRLVWEEGNADFRTREPTPILKYYDHVSLRFRLSASKEIRTSLEYPASEKLKQFLEEGRIAYTSNDMYHARGAVEGTKFIIPCEVKASLLLYSQLDLGKLLLRTINVSDFGTQNHILSPQAITEGALDELAAFILGEARELGPLLRRQS